ncbi:MAG: synthase, epsilon subunit, sector [Actinomycetota bacterium]|jgi:F-type H+-transporting ATPase subunit epsilon
MTLKVALVSPERELWSGEATMVLAKTTEGDIGILKDHEPILALVADGAVVRITTTSNEVVVAAVHGGFLSVDSNVVRILAEVAELATDIDVVRAKAALEKARQSEDDKAAAAARRAEARLRASEIALMR